MGKTSTEVKQRWESKTYKKYMIRMRIEDDAAIINFIESQKKEGKQTSELFKEALEVLMKTAETK